MNGDDAVVNKDMIDILVENNEDADDAAIASAEKIGRRTSEEEALDAAVNTRYACTRFQRHQEPLQ